MKIAITLNKNIQCEQICAEIQKLVTKLSSSQDISQSILVIDIIQITDGGDSHIPKIEYHPDSPT
jgi:hypothetical protein